MRSFMSRISNAFALLCALLLTANLASAGDNWSSLRYEGSRFLISLTADVSRTRLDNRDGKLTLLPVPGVPETPALPERLWKFDVRLQFLASDRLFEIWTRESDLQVLQRTAVYTGIKDWHRIYRYLPDVTYAAKIKPESGENSLPYTEWSNRQESLLPAHPAADGEPFTEAEALFHLISNGILQQPGDQYRFNVFDKKGIVGIQLTADRAERIPFAFDSIAGGKSRKQSGRSDVLVVSLSVIPPKDQDPEDFDFMGFKEDIRLYVDPLRNVVLRVSGLMDYMGRVTIDLRQMELAVGQL